MIETIILSKDSNANGSSRWMMISSAGANPIAPFQTTQPFVFSTTDFNFGSVKVTGAKTSMTSAVPAAAVIAREDSLGILKPQAATIGTMIIVVRVPDTPPVECLSATIPEKDILLPVSTIDFVK